MRQQRTAVRKLKATARTGDLHAMLMLLKHSVAYGHKRLSVRRYLMARALGAPEIEPAKPFCRLASRTMPLEDVLDAARMAVRSAPRPTGAYEIAVELVGPAMPLILPYDGTSPKINGEPRASGDLSCLIGRTEIGARFTMGSRAVIRADGHVVRIGDDFSIGPNSTVHIAHDVLPAIIGHRVAVGENACVHACTVGDDCVIGNGVVVLDGAVVENDVVIEDEAIVFPRAHLQSGYLYGGSPAKPIRKLAEGERASRALQVREKTARAILKRPPASHERQAPSQNFVASTATLTGRIEMEAQSSVFFSCVLNAKDSSIHIGARTNIQDNTTIESAGSPVVIGADTTIGHNVFIRGSEIGARALIGIGASLAPGTIVEDDAFVAAGATTTPGQRITGGSVWGGRPARPIAPLDDAKKDMMQTIIGHYCRYAAAFHEIEGRSSPEACAP
jgi:carbonic anhydrase/acetyltransferase-like protein (isoleucine patch superfamily)